MAMRAATRAVQIAVRRRTGVRALGAVRPTTAVAECARRWCSTNERREAGGERAEAEAEPEGHQRQAGQFKVGDFVEARDGSEKWRYGFVVGIDMTGEPKILCDGWVDAAYFSQVRKIETTPPPEWAKPGSRAIVNEQYVTIDRIDHNVMWVTPDGYHQMSTYVTTPIGQLNETLAQEVIFLLRYPNRVVQVLKQEGPAVIGLYGMLRMPLFCFTVYTAACAPGSQMATLGASLIAVGHLTRPFCLYIALFIARKKRWWTALMASRKTGKDSPNDASSA